MSAREPDDTPFTVEDLLDWLRGVVDRDGVDGVDGVDPAAELRVALLDGAAALHVETMGGETLLFRLDPSPLVLRVPA